MAFTRDLPILDLPDRAAWEGWLTANHDRSAGVWLKIAKKVSPRPTVSQAEAIEEAVCFGWIDGQIGSYDEHFYLQRFTARRARSKWSAINRDRARRLMGEGRMRPSGLAQYKAAEADGRLADAYAPQSQVTVPQDFQDALDSRPETRAFFDCLASADRYRFLYRLHHTKDPRRRAERIANYVELLSQRETLA